MNTYIIKSFLPPPLSFENFLKNRRPRAKTENLEISQDLSKIRRAIFLTRVSRENPVPVDLDSDVEDGGKNGSRSFIHSRTYKSSRSEMKDRASMLKRASLLVRSLLMDSALSDVIFLFFASSARSHILSARCLCLGLSRCLCFAFFAGRNV